MTSKPPSLPANCTYVIALTGGIASGKTTVSQLFSELEVPVVDTDVLARKVVAPGQPALKRITIEFGSEYILSDGRLDRKKMREKIFQSPQAKIQLEAILHPVIESEAVWQIGLITEPYCILVVPLLVESLYLTWTDRVLLVDTSNEMQLQRVMKRDRIDLEHAHKILNAQASREERLKIADDIIDNNGSSADLESQVSKLNEKYTCLALGIRNSK